MTRQNKHLHIQEPSLQGQAAGNRSGTPLGGDRDGDQGRDGEQAARLARIKAQVKNGTYRADIMDIATHLARAMDPQD